MLGARADERFLLANALHVVARERGASSWPALVAEAKRGRIVTALDEALDEDGRAEIEVETDLAYPEVSLRLARSSLDVLEAVFELE